MRPVSTDWLCGYPFIHDLRFVIELNQLSIPSVVLNNYRPKSPTRTSPPTMKGRAQMKITRLALRFV
jgi:hypothetical protein